MARLTRTQKFAALREELANSSEQTTVNNDLNKYKEKLDSLQNASENVEKKEEYDIKVDPLPTYNEVKEEVREEKQVEKDILGDLDLESINSAIDEIIGQTVAILDNPKDDEKFDLGFHEEEKSEVEPVIEEVKPVEVENITSLIDQTLEELTEVIGDLDTTEPEVEVELLTEEEKPIVVPERVEEPYNYIEQDYADIAELLKNEVLELNGPVEPVKEEEEVIVEPEIIVPERVEEPYNHIEQDYADIAGLLKNEVLELNGPVEPIKEEEPVVELDVESLIPDLTEEVELPDLSIPEVDSLVVEEPELSELPNFDSLIDNLVVEEEKNEDIVLPGLDVQVVEEESSVDSNENVPDVVLPDLDIPKLDEEVSSQDELVEENDDTVVEEATNDVSEVDEAELTNVDVNSLLDKTLEEVADYNTQAGRMTVDQISNDLIEEVRQGHLNEEKEDDDFSNTVTLEIDKVLSEINLEPVVAPISVEKVLEKTVEIDPIDVKRDEAAEKLADTLAHPALAKVLEESPVEIKSLDETFTKDLSTTATLSFKKNEIAEEDDEDY